MMTECGRGYLPLLTACLLVVVAPTRSDTRPVELSLTPWWPMWLGVGEEAVIDCGLPNGGDSSLAAKWLDPKGQVIGDQTDNRMSVTTTGNTGEDQSAFTVTTLNITNLAVADSGTYKCVLTESNTSKEISQDIKINVVDGGMVCAFESASLCGWTADEDSSIIWHRHTAKDKDILARKVGARFDHTYGASKHIGHYLDIDVPDHTNDKTSGTAVLKSPVFNPSEGKKCLSMAYHIFEKDESDLVHLKVSLLSNGTVVELNDSKIEESGKLKWLQKTVEIPSQLNDYQVTIEANVCKDTCRKVVVSIDDIIIQNDSCAEAKDVWPKNEVKVRLVDEADTPFYGSLEVLHDGQWGSVCGRKFGNKEAQVICQTLGYEGDISLAIGKRNATFGKSPDSYVIWLSNVQCRETDEDFGECLAPDMSWGDVEGCNHGEDAGVSCAGLFSPPASTATTTAPTTTISTTTASSTTSSTTESVTTTSPTTDNNETVPVVPVEPVKPETPTPPPTTPAPTPPTTTIGFTTTTTAPSTEKPKPTPTPSVKSTTISNKNKTTTTVVRPTQFVSPTTTTNNTEPSSSPPSGIALEGVTSHAGVVIGIIIVIVVISAVVFYVFYRRKRKGKKSTYITFGNPSYSREHLPANDFSLESPLTLSSNGYTVLA